MFTQQTHDKCKYFSIRNRCPHRNEKIMAQFVMDSEFQPGLPLTLDYSKADDINKICSECNAFTPHGTR